MSASTPVLSPPNEGHPSHKAVYHLQILGHLHRMESQDEGRDHAGVQQHHGVKDTETDQWAQ
eukprot:CAMPEP_0172745678 /NCGR_PEP_ID=MMETSP1074-20121228/138542_1 /TAXON_ID=2916 /ORGANISM="Ceratium fusus, Strain PA161109" /LENGTH=61 /DNA_ID=CAMNT_0013576913 /DNA_START=1004 /DNA_END=1189 /DNA_ORIENTATION=-